MIMKKLAFLVDDDPGYRQYVKTFLSGLGYEMLAFEDGTQFMEKLHMNPDVIILDHQLGKDQEDGLELLRMVKREHPDIPVIYLSGQHDIAPVVQALKLGSIEYIEKNSGALVKLKSVLEELESKKKKKGFGGWF